MHHHVAGGGGLQLFVEEVGNPHGVPILFIHGFTQSHLCWFKQQVPTLTNDCRMIFLDNRGHGQSEKPPGVYTDSALWAQDVQAVMDYFELDHPVLAAWSYGGLVVCDYLRMFGDEGIRGINLIGAITQKGTEQSRAYRSPERLKLSATLGSSDAVKSVEALSAFVRLCAFRDIPLADFYLMLGYNVVVPPYVREALEHRTVSNLDLLPAIRKPVLISHGVEDRLVSLDAAKHHAQLIPGAKTSFYPNVGHMPFYEAAERFNQELKDFVLG